jgi:hypothetical protein
MAVTTANTLKLSDVCNEIYGSPSTSGKSLAGCHAAASGTFNGAYATAGGNSLLDFRGYEHVQPDTTAPTVGYLSYDGANGPGEIDVSWTASTDNVGVTEHSVWYKRTTDSVYIKYGTTFPNGNAGSMTMTGFDLGGSYHLKLRADDAAGNYSYDKVINATAGTSISDSLTISPSSMWFDEYGDWETLTITCSTTWTASDNRSWIGLSSTSGSGNSQITVTVPNNPDTFERTGTVTVQTTSGSITRTCGITQMESTGGGPQCLVDGTLVTLSDGSRMAIEYLSVGDELMHAKIANFNDTNDIRILKDVELDTLSVSTGSTKITKIHREIVDTTISINDGYLRATPFHTHFVRRGDTYTFKRFHELRPHDYLITSSNEEIEINRINILDEPVQINKITLEDGKHTFYANNLITHNIK